MRRLYLKSGDEAPRGPLAEADVRAAFNANVLSPGTLAGESLEDLRPVAEVLGPAPLPKPSNTGRILLAIGGLVIAGGVISGVTLYVRNRPPPLCESTPKILGSLEKHVTATLFVTPGNPKLDLSRRKVEGMLRMMESSGGGKLDVKVVEVRTDEDKKKAEEAGLQMMAIENDGAGSAIRSAYFGIVFEQGAERDAIKVLHVESDENGTEFWVVNKLREIDARAGGKKRRTAIMIGHGGNGVGDQNIVPKSGSVAGPTLKKITEQYFPYHRLEDVDLATGTIEPEMRGVILTQPDVPLTKPELEKLDEHVMRGGALAIIASAAHLSHESNRFESMKLDTRGLDTLTAAYGLELGKDIVFEEKHRLELGFTTASKIAYDWVPLVEKKDGLDVSGGFFFNLEQVAFPLASSITLHKDRQPGATYRVWAHTAPTAKRAQVDTVSLGSTKASSPPRNGESGSFILAASVDGVLTSAFGKGKSVKPARVLLIASSAFLSNPFVEGDQDAAMPYVQTHGTTSILIFKNLLDWAAFDDGLADCNKIVTKPK